MPLTWSNIKSKKQLRNNWGHMTTSIIHVCSTNGAHLSLGILKMIFAYNKLLIFLKHMSTSHNVIMNLTMPYTYTCTDIISMALLHSHWNTETERWNCLMIALFEERSKKSPIFKQVWSKNVINLNANIIICSTFLNWHFNTHTNQFSVCYVKLMCSDYWL